MAYICNMKKRANKVNVKELVKVVEEPFIGSSEVNGNSVYTINRLYFRSMGILFNIIGCISTGAGVYDMKYLVLNTETGSSKNIEMIQLIKLFNTKSIE